MAAKVEEEEEEESEIDEESGGDDDDEDREDGEFAPRYQSQGNPPGFMMPLKRPHCSLPCWWRGNRGWERIKAMNLHMKAMYVWIHVTALMHLLLAAVFTSAFNSLDYQSATDAVPLKSVAAGVRTFLAALHACVE
jgi:hypothetical protein